MKNSFRFVVIIAALCFLMSSLGLAYEDEIKSLTADLAKKITGAGKKVVAVVDFVDLQGNVTELGRFLAEELSVSLASSDNGFEVVDRTNLKAIIKESKLSLTGLIDPATAQKIGKIAGTDALITGTLTPFGDSVRLAVKVLDTGTAKIITASTINIAKTKAIEDLFSNSITTSNDSSRISDKSQVTNLTTTKKDFGLVGYWSLDEIDGINIKDLTGNGNNGLICGGPVLVTGKLGKGIKFDGLDDYIRIDNLISNDFTICFWLKTTQVASSGQWYKGVGLVDGECPGVTNDFGISIISDKLGFGIGNPDTTITSNSSINDGN
jgi:TolB-like protein